MKITHLARFEREEAARALKVPQDMIDPYFDEISARLLEDLEGRP